MIPGITRVEPGTGVKITYSVNSDNEAVWIASIDSDYINQLLSSEISKNRTDSDWIIRQIESKSIDSDFLNRVVTTEIDKNRTDSDWIIRQIESKSIDSDFLTRVLTAEISKNQIDSDWILNKLESVQFDSDYVSSIMPGMLMDMVDSDFLVEKIEEALNSVEAKPLDSDFVVSVLNNTLSVPALDALATITSQINEIRSILGLGPVQVVEEEIIINPVEGDISYTQIGSILTENLTFRISLTSNNDDVVYYSDITVSAGSNVTHVLKSLSYKVISSSIAMLYFDSFVYNVATNKVDFEIKEKFAGFRITLDISKIVDQSAFYIAPK